MKKSTFSLLVLAGLTAAAPAFAQEAAPAAPQQAAPAAPSAAAPAAAGAVSDAEVNQFAAAMVEVQKINADAAVPAADKQTKMASAVTASGLTPDRFNAIGSALSSDTALQAKVGAAVQAKSGAAAAPAPAQ